MKRSILCATVVILATAACSFGANRNFLGTGGWDDATKWGGTVPGSTGADNAIIAAWDVCSVTNAAAPEFMVNTWIRGGNGVLNIQADFSSNGGDVLVGQAGSDGLLNHSAGTVTIDDLLVTGGALVGLPCTI